MQTSTKNSELLHTQNTSEKTNTDKENSSKLIERQQVDGSPYWIIGNYEDGYSLRFGKYKLTENKPTVEEVEIELDKNKLNVILQTILAVTSEQMNSQINPLKHEQTK